MQSKWLKIIQRHAGKTQILLALIIALTCGSTQVLAEDTTSSEASKETDSGVAKKEPAAESQPKPEPTPATPQPTDGNQTPQAGESPKATDQTSGNQAPTEENKTPEYHRAQMKISGSMCFSCLHDLKKSLNKIDGIIDVRIDRPSMGVQMYSPAMVSYAQAVIYYDANKVPLYELREYMKRIGYHAYKIQDKPADKLPAPETKKKNDSA